VPVLRGAPGRVRRLGGVGVRRSIQRPAARPRCARDRVPAPSEPQGHGRRPVAAADLFGRATWGPADRSGPARRRVRDQQAPRPKGADRARGRRSGQQPAAPHATAIAHDVDGPMEGAIELALSDRVLLRLERLQARFQVVAVRCYDCSPTPIRTGSTSSQPVGRTRRNISTGGSCEP
jgi:hypothetical protein